MKLIEIFSKLEIDNEVIANRSEIDIKGISLNSREVGQNDIFVAIKGFKTDGHKYIINAFQNGVTNFIIEDCSFITDEVKAKSSIIKVKDCRTSMALVSNNINDYPFNKLTMIGVTGTKGKTTVSTLTYNLLKAKYKTNLFSTVKNIINDKVYDSVRTTMESDKLQSYLKESIDNSRTHSVVEVSSHAVTLKRIYGINWDVAIFTNLSQDHLDLYGTMDNYFDAKLDFFRNLNRSSKKNKLAIVNIDDKKGFEVCKVVSQEVKLITVGKDKSADYLIENYKADADGIELTLRNNNKSYHIKSKLRGEFNITNISLAFVCALELGVDYETIREEILKINGIEGRFEIVVDKPFYVIVDYAHTPDSLQKILNEGRNIAKNRLISVFGCTGDRDREKRPIMGEISAVNADYTIITNDDTYTENPNDIAKSVETGFVRIGKMIKRDYEIILDRKEAIKRAIKIARKGDVIIIAGMGHEKYQIIGDKSIPYSDKETILALMK